jgi:hypothetical protein
MPADYGPESIEAWEHLYEKVCAAMEAFGAEDSFQVLGDYWVQDDYWGYPQVKVYVRNVALLEPPVVAALQNCLAEFPGSEIVVAVAVRGSGETWPEMGLVIRLHEIIDGLRRSYLPARFRNLSYAGARPGKERD